MKKTIKRNLYAASDVMAAIALLLLFAFVVEKEKKYGVAFGIMGAVSFITMVTQMCCGKTKIENESGEIAYTKSEEGCDAVELEPGASRYDIDGVKSHGRTHKLVDGVHAVVKDDGTVKVKSLTGRFINAVRGGILDKAPDSCWDELFKA